MNTTQYIKTVAASCRSAGDLAEEEAYRLFGAMLDGAVPELEMGAILVALRMKSESLSELEGFHRALAERLATLPLPTGTLRPVVVPAYGGALTRPNLLPLLVLLLQRFGVPVLIHGTLEGRGRVATAYILREFGVMPCATLSQARQTLQQEGLALVPTALLSPALAALLGLRARLGVRVAAHAVVKLIDPFRGEGLRLVGASHDGYLERFREFLAATRANALLLKSTEGEPFADPLQRPCLEYFEDGHGEVLFEAERGSVRHVPGLPESCDAATTAAWTRQVLAGEVPLPLPVVNQLACCLYACGYTRDLSQAKAIAAVETGSLAQA